MKPMEIRTLTIKDQCHCETLAALAAYLGRERWSTSQFAAELANPFCHLTLCHWQGVPAGFCAAHIDDTAVIQLICVAPHLRKKGIATALLAHLFAACKEKNITLCTLDVRASNHGAIQFYERCGFTLAHTTKHGYTHPDEAKHIYVKPLP